jgi:hypothetical protein
MDNMRLGVDEPAEEELAMARLCPWSSYHCFHFPRRSRECFRQSVLLEGVPAGTVERWKHAYETLLRKATLDLGGRRLVLKNPANTARIARILEIFPDARFIHIYRNPYLVYPSTRHLWLNLLPLWALQEYDIREVEGNILDFYRQLLGRFFEQRRLIRPGHLVEVRFEDLEVRPLEQMRRIYGELGLEGFDAARPSFEAYLASLATYRKNTYSCDPLVVRRVNEHWSFAVDRWGYRPPASNGESRAIPARECF